MRGALRSALFVPADDSLKLAKAARFGADAVNLDLEDGVTSERKVLARAAVSRAADAIAADGTAVIFRINAHDEQAAADVASLSSRRVGAVMVPKIDGVGRIRRLYEAIAQAEAAAKRPVGEIGLILLIESAEGLVRLPELAAEPRVVGIALGSEDFSLELGVEPTAECLDLPCRLIALAASVRRQAALALPISIAAFRDRGAMTNAARSARAYGITGALCVHPAQVEVANAFFAPSAEVVAKARAILDAWARAQADGLSIATLDGDMIDLPIVIRAQRTLEGAGPSS